MPRLTDPRALETFRAELRKDRESWPMRVTLSGGTCGEASGSVAVLKELQNQLECNDLTELVHLRVTGCQGYCQEEPLLILEPLNVLYCKVTAADVAEIVSESLLGGRRIIKQ